MSISTNSSTYQRPRLMSSGWGWPRLVDIPASSPSPRRSTSVRNFKGATLIEEDDPFIEKSKKRATSLKSHSSFTKPTGDVPAAKIQLQDDCEKFVKPAPFPESTELVKIEEQPKEEPEALQASDPQLNSEGASPLLVETSDHPQEIVLTASELLPSLQEKFSQMSHDIDPISLPALPLSLIPKPSGASTIEEPEAKSLSSESMEDIVVRVLGNTRIPGPEPAVDEPKTRTELSHPFSEIESSYPVSTETNQDALQSFPSFGDLPTETLTVVHSEASGPVDTAKLPVPEIVIIRATDSVDDLVHTPDTSNPQDPFGFVLRSIEAPLPGDFTQIEPPEVPLPEGNLLAEDIGELQVLGLVRDPHTRKGHVFVRKMRKVVLRSPVLTVLLGRQLALLARPALKIIASGGDVGVAALNPGLNMTEAAGAPLKVMTPVL